MSVINFYLKHPSVKSDPKFTQETLIYLFASNKGQRVKMSIGEKIKPSEWNDEKMRANRNYKGFTDFNSYLDKLEYEAKTIIREINTNGQSIEVHFKDRMKEVMGLGETVVEKSFKDVVNEYLETKSLNSTASTIRKYKCSLNHLISFAKAKNVKLSFDIIDLSLLERFGAYLIYEENQLNSSQSKYMKNIKTFLRWANERGYHDNLQFTKMKIKEYQTDIIYLTDSELMSLYNLDLTKNKRLDQVRDILCFECFTGLRFADVKQLSKENIKGDTITIMVKKTRDRLFIPINDYAKEILGKYNNKLPNISGQRTNEYLKELGELAGINEPTEITKHKGAEIVRSIQKKYELITTHTGRRTFITLSLEKGMRPEVIMAITGHKKYETFKKYIRLTDKVLKVEMGKAWNREKQSKVVNLY